MKKYMFPVITVILVLFFVRNILPTQDPDRCAICDAIPHHAPCLVNLATGEVGELEVYDPHPFKVAEINEYQQGGTFSFLYVAGLYGYRDTANWETHITIPVNEKKYEEKFFCKSCRARISNHTDDGFLLVDLQTPERFSILTSNLGESIFLRCYEIQILNKIYENEVIVYGKHAIVDHRIQ